MPPQTNPNTGLPIFGGPDDGRPSNAPPSYGEKIDRWKDKIKKGKGNKDKLRDKIQGARVDRWQDRVKAEKKKPVPRDAAYNTDVTAAYGKYATNLTGLGLQRTSVDTDYGFLPQYQQGGAAYNPYSQAAKLQSAYEIEKRRTLNDYAAAGQLYSGARQNAFNSDQREYVTADQAARDSWLKEIAELDADQAQAGTDLAADLVAAEEAFAGRIPEATDPGPLPKYVRREKKDLKKRKGNLRDKLGDAKNKYARKKIKKSIKRTTKKISKLDPYKDVR